MYSSPYNYTDYTYNRNNTNQYPFEQNRSYNRSFQSFDRNQVIYTPPDHYRHSPQRTQIQYRNQDFYNPNEFTRGPEPYRGPQIDISYRAQDPLRRPESRYTPQRDYNKYNTVDRTFYQPPLITDYSRVSNYPLSNSFIQQEYQNRSFQNSLLTSSVGGLVSDMEYLYFEGEGEFTKYRLQPRKFPNQHQ